VDPYRLAGIGFDQVGTLLVDAHAEVFEHRQAQGQAQSPARYTLKRNAPGAASMGRYSSSPGRRMLARMLHQFDIAHGGTRR
jgi:hypothetical protein